MAITFAKLGDTPASLTRDLLGYDDVEFSQRLWRENAPFLCRMGGNGTSFATPYPIWIPEDDSPMGAQAARLQLTYFESLSPMALEILNGCQEAGMGITDLLELRETVGLFQKLFDESSQEMGLLSDDTAPISQGVAFTLAGMHTGMDVRKRYGDDVVQKVKNLQKALLDERSVRLSKSAMKFVDKELLAEKKLIRLQALKEVQSVKRSVFSKIQGETFFSTSEWDWSRALRRKTWKFGDVFDSAHLSELGELLERLGRCLIALDAIMDLWRIIHDARQGKDWEFEVVEDIIDIAFSWGSGFVLAYALVPLIGLGWPLILVIILGVILGGAANLIFQDIAHPRLEAYLKPLIDKAVVFYETEIHRLRNLL
jgi:hypothetical protein